MASSVAPQSLKERQRQEREQLILQAAQELLIEQGYHETSIDQIAARVGISKGTVYQHFPSKEDLVLALFELNRERFQQAVDTILAGEGSPRERLRELLFFTHKGLASKGFQLLSMIFQSPELRSRFVALMGEKEGEQEKSEKDRKHAEWEAITEKVGALIEAGKRSGDFDVSIPTPIMVAVFTSLMNPHSSARLIEREQMDPAVIAEQMCRFFFKGIAAEQPHDHTAVCRKEGEAYAPVE